MGNCMNKMQQHGEQERDREEATTIGQVLQQQEEEVVPPAGVKVKVVLTRTELEWLMAQLKSGEQRLEDVLRQMGTARADHKPKPHREDGYWRPRLERIVECPTAGEAT